LSDDSADVCVTGAVGALCPQAFLLSLVYVVELPQSLLGPLGRGAGAATGRLAPELDELGYDFDEP
jgi:hypothetical protein